MKSHILAEAVQVLIGVPICALIVWCFCTGCAVHKPTQLPAGMNIVGKYLCTVQANDAKTMQPKVMTCDDGKGNRTTWKAE